MGTQIENTTFKFPQNIVGIIVSEVDGLPLGVVSKNIMFGETRHMFVNDAKNTTIVKRIGSSIKGISIVQKHGPDDPKQCSFSISDSIGNVAHTSWDPNFNSNSYDNPISVMCIAGQPQIKFVKITYVKRNSKVVDIHFHILRIDYKCNVVDYAMYANIVVLFMIVLFIAFFIINRTNTKKKKKAAKEKDKIATDEMRDAKELLASW